MFGVIVPGRLPRLGDAFEQIGPQQWLARMGTATPSFTVFLTGQAPLPNGAGLAVYLALQTDACSWTLLGALTNQVPSLVCQTPPSFLQLHHGVDVALGLKMMSVDELENLLGGGGGGSSTSLHVQQARAAQLDFVAGRVLTSFFDFAASFSRVVNCNSAAAISCAGDDDASSSTVGDGERSLAREEMVVLPLKAVETWRRSLASKIAKDPTLWLSE
jgi:hypothetical protein